jgi:hypothetical protein
MSESEAYEEKGHFDWAFGQQFDLLKTIVAFANREGGRIVLNTVKCDVARLDSARLDDFVNKYVSPRVGGIASKTVGEGALEISVAKSDRAPHVIAHEASYEDQKGRTRSAFYPGQIYVRHSSKSEPATADDVHKMIQRILGAWIGKIGQSIENLSLDIVSDKTSLPVGLTDDSAALTIAVADPNTDYPFTTNSLGQQIGRNQNWTHKAAGRLGLKDSHVYSLPIKGANGQVVVRRYNARALEVLKKKLEEHPDYDPYHE